MWHKIIIVVLFVLMLVSLGRGLSFLMADHGHGRQLLWSLGFRVTLAVLIVAVIAHGLWTGALSLSAPWHP